MNINITLIGQMITFAIFVWFTMKFVWPPVIAALKERQSKIADGLAAAERGHKELKLSQSKATDQIRYARREAGEIVEQANKRAAQIIEQAKEKAREEGARQLVLAKEEINQEINHAKQALRQQVASVAIAGAEKILGRSVDAAANSDLLDKLVKEI